MIDKLDDQWRQVVRQWDQLSQRDKLAIQVLSVVIAVVFFIVLVINPIVQFKEKAQRRFVDETEVLRLIKSQNLPQSVSNQSSSRKQSLVTLVTQTTQRHKLAFKRYEPKQNDTIRVWFDSAEFNQFMKWLDHLRKQHAIQIDDISIDRGAQSE